MSVNSTNETCVSEFYFLDSAGCQSVHVLLFQKTKRKVCGESLYHFCTFAVMAELQEALKQGHEV
jgi:hypothetical protein